MIAIIAVLAGILLAALSGVQQAAKKTKTTTLMQSFARACDEFALDHGRYPGLLPDSALDGTTITSTQNALLELMGGARARHSSSPSTVVDEFDAFNSSSNTVEFTGVGGSGWDIVFNQSRFGEGPWISGRIYEPYFSPKSSDLEYKGSYDNDNPPAEGEFGGFPSLVDAWETPIIYLRSIRKSGPIMDDPVNSGDTDYALPQFELPKMDLFFSGALNSNLSLISEDSEDRVTWLSLLLSHPTFWEQDDTWFSNGPYTVAWSTPRGRYMLLSAGPNTIYLEIENQPTNPDSSDDDAYSVGDIMDSSNNKINPTIMDSFDDVVVYGG